MNRTGVSKGIICVIINIISFLECINEIHQMYFYLLEKKKYELINYNK